jgi:chemotaxis protein MotC
MTTIARFAPGLIALTMACTFAHAEEARAPSDLMRELRASQDRITRGDTDAHLSQRTLLARIAGQLASAKAEVWKEPRNARAAVAFVLGGGTPAILKRLIDLGALSGMDDKLARGVLAYGEGRDADALELLGALDARALDASLGGHIALAKAELIAKKDPKQALEFLDEARLLAPGMLIEEAALRRQVTIVAATGEFDRFVLLSGNYLRRFSKSVYADAFRRQFAVDVAARADSGEDDNALKLQGALDGLEPGDRRDLYLAIARDGLIRGGVQLARFAASHAGPLFEGGSAGRLRASLYEAAALVLTDDIDKGASMLEAMDKAKLGEEEAELASAASAVAAEIRRLPPIADAAEPAGGADIAATFKVAGSARKTMARVDELLMGRGQ